jgi:hypothetical protein
MDLIRFQYGAAPSGSLSGVTSAKNVAKATGSLFVGTMWFNMATPGTAKYVTNAGIGENGIVSAATNVLTV